VSKDFPVDMMKSAVILIVPLIRGTLAFSPCILRPILRPSLQLKAQRRFQNAVTSAIVASTLALAPLATPPAVAYEDSDYASETVTAVVDSLRNAGSNAEETFKVYENIAAIITEGKGVGGSINYRKCPPPSVQG
jgi:hypothetical protein